MKRSERRRLIRNAGGGFLGRLFNWGRVVGPWSTIQIAIEHALKDVPKKDHTKPSHAETIIEGVRRQAMAKREARLAHKKGKIRQILAQTFDEIKRLTGNHSKSANELENAEFEFEEAKNARNQHLGKFHIGKICNFVILLLLFGPELLLSALIFERMSTNLFEQWAYAVPIGMSIPLLAHFLGAKTHKTDKRVIPGVIFAASATTLIFFTSIVRTLELVRVGLIEGEHLFLMTMFFISLNIAIFGLAYGVSYNAHHPQISHDLKWHQQARRRLWIARLFHSRNQKNLKKNRQKYAVYMERLSTFEQKRYWMSEWWMAWRDYLIGDFRMILPLVNSDQTDVYCEADALPICEGAGSEFDKRPEEKKFPDIDQIGEYDDRLNHDLSEPAHPDIKLVETNEDKEEPGSSAAALPN